jgi:hypothetical protein
MSEADPFRRQGGEPKPTTIKLDGPNVSSTLHTPPRADALKAQDAAIRKHLKRRGGDAERDRQEAGAAAPDDPAAPDEPGEG